MLLGCFFFPFFWLTLFLANSFFFSLSFLSLGLRAAMLAIFFFLERGFVFSCMLPVGKPTAIDGP